MIPYDEYMGAYYGFNDSDGDPLETIEAIKKYRLPPEAHFEEEDYEEIIDTLNESN